MKLLFIDLNKANGGLLRVDFVKQVLWWEVFGRAR